MNLANFLFLDGEDVIFDNEVSFIRNNNIVEFSLDGNKFIFKREKGHLCFMKESKDSILEISNLDECIVALYTLKEEGLSFNLDLESFECAVDQNKYSIKYRISGDEDKEKCIIFSMR